jgi:hypothetical protein
MLNNPFMFIVDKGCTKVEMLNKPRVLNAHDIILLFTHITFGPSISLPV